ncbi:MAG: hypothetical protein QOK15_1357 [Nocardioidaceae bacterium]|nr:hypothetical protein [Nocardioidaceae bacterium]
MSLDDIFRRIVRAHALLLVVCAIVPLAVVLVLALISPRPWEAKIRVQTSVQLPSSSTESDAMSSRVVALATTPALIQKVLDQIGVDRDPVSLARTRISVVRLGESSMVELTVIDPERTVAKGLAQGLVRETTDFLTAAQRQSIEEAKTQLDHQIATASTDRDSVEEEFFASTNPIRKEVLSSRMNAAQHLVNTLLDERGALVSTEAAGDAVVPVDLNEPTLLREPSTLPARSVLAVLLGLLVGLGGAVFIETVRPRIGGIRVLARELDTPLLGTTESPTELANSLTMASRRKGVETVVLVGADDRDEKVIHQLLTQLPRTWPHETTDLMAPLHQPAPTRQPGGTDPDAMPVPPLNQGPTALVRFTNLFGVAPAEEVTAGIVVVTSGAALRRDLDRLDDLLRAMRWPLVGVVENVSRRSTLASKVPL